MALSDLPPEVVDNFVQCLAESDKIAQYSTISLVFQGVVEKRVFSSLNLTSQDLDDLGKLVGRFTHRKAAIRSIFLSVILPTYTDQACSWFETEDDKIANNLAFTEAVTTLFTALSSCDNVDRAQPISLFLGRAFSPMDIDQRGAEKVRADQFAVELNQRKDLFRNRYKHSYISLLQPETLPIVRRVKNITIRSEASRCLAPATAVHITSRLPNVETIQWNLQDAERRHRELRIDHRQAFAQALRLSNLEKATTLKLKLAHESPSNEGHTSFDVRSPGEVLLDSFSRMLGDFIRSSNLVKIELGGPICIGPELFSLVASSGLQTAPWPCLQELLITFSAVRPDGGWYFDRSPTDRATDDESDDSDEAEYIRMAAWRGDDIDADTESSSSGYESDDSFFETTERPPDHYNESRERYRSGMSPIRSLRTVPSPALEELLTAAVEAVLQTPALHTISVRADIQSSARTEWNSQVFELVFAAAGYDNWMDEGVEDRQHRRLTWTGPSEWRPGQSLADAWQKVLGEDGIVKYQEW